MKIGIQKKNKGEKTTKLTACPASSKTLKAQKCLAIQKTFHGHEGEDNECFIFFFISFFMLSELVL